MRLLLLLLAAAALGLSSALLAACGDRNQLIPQANAEAIKSDLDDASADLEAEECRRAQAAVRQAQRRVGELPDQVDEGLRANLENGLVHVRDRIQADCGRRTTPTTTATTPTQPTQPTRPPETQPTEPPETQPTAPPKTEPEPEPEPGPGQNNGSGGTPSGDGGGNRGADGGGGGTG